MKSTATETTVVAESEEKSEAEQVVIFDKTTEKGEEGGLFQACMVSIRNSHKSANRLRAALVVSGLFTDVNVYREVIALFYLATNAMETKMLALKDEGDEICDKLLSLGYRFSPQYEKDLKTLYNLGNDDNNENDNWKVAVEMVLNKSTNGAKAYIKTIENMSSGDELAGAAFCLWGALIIGGGAAALPRVKRLCGKKDACHLFRDVTGPGRGERKAKFIKMWDSLSKDEKRNGNKDNDGKKSFGLIVAVCQDCMQGNNELIISVKTNPWWLKYFVFTAVAAVSAVVFNYQEKCQIGRT